MSIVIPRQFIALDYFKQLFSNFSYYHLSGTVRVNSFNMGSDVFERLLLYLGFGPRK